MNREKVYARHLAEGERMGGRYVLSVPREALAGREGHFGGQYTGNSLEFMEFREYRPGDDLRRIDWSAYARTDRLIIRRYREEVAPHADLILDASASMTLPETEKTKAALTLAGLIATAAANAGCTCAAWTAGAVCRPVDQGTALPSSWGNLSFDASETPWEAFRTPGVKWRRRGIRVFISDLLFPGDPGRIISRLSEGAAALFVLQILAEEDMAPAGTGNMTLADTETGERLNVRLTPETLRAYADVLSAHQRLWREACRKAGARFLHLKAERLTSRWDAAPLFGIGLLEVCR